jgi:hypothetical protein
LEFYFCKSIQHAKLCRRRTYCKETVKILQQYVLYCKTTVLACLGNSCISNAYVPSVSNKTNMASNCSLICYTTYEFHFSFQQSHSLTKNYAVHITGYTTNHFIQFLIYVYINTFFKSYWIPHQANATCTACTLF